MNLALSVFVVRYPRLGYPSLGNNNPVSISCIFHVIPRSYTSFAEGLHVALVYFTIAHHFPLPDSLILATARAHSATLWTQDEHFKALTG
jgi:hypothetical protein